MYAIEYIKEHTEAREQKRRIESPENTAILVDAKLAKLGEFVALGQNLRVINGLQKVQRELKILVRYEDPARREELAKEIRFHLDSDLNQEAGQRRLDLFEGDIRKHGDLKTTLIYMN